MNTTGDILILVPTTPEAEALFDTSPPSRGVLPLARFGEGVATGLVGFGLATAGVNTTLLIRDFEPRACLLLGIAGALEPPTLGRGELLLGTEVHCHGIGAGTGSQYQSFEHMGFSPCPSKGPAALPLVTPDVNWALHEASIATVTACSASDGDVDAVRAAAPEALAEDMETWAVAYACRRAEVPLTVARALSNNAGNRDKSTWRVDRALANLRDALPALLSALRATIA